MNRELRDAEGEIRQAIRRLGYDIKYVSIEDPPYRDEPARLELTVPLEAADRNENQVE